MTEGITDSLKGVKESFFVAIKAWENGNNNIFLKHFFPLELEAVAMVRPHPGSSLPQSPDVSVSEFGAGI